MCERQYDGVIIELCFLTSLGLNPSLVSVWPWAFLSLSFFVYKKETIIPSSGLLPGINEAKHARSQGKAPHMLNAQIHVNYCYSTLEVKQCLLTALVRQSRSTAHTVASYSLDEESVLRREVKKPAVETVLSAY